MTDLRDSRLQFSKLLRSSLKASLVVGFLVGAFEAFSIAVKVLFSNSLEFWLLTELVIFVNIGIVIFILFMMAINIITLPVSYSLLKIVVSKFEEFDLEKWLWRFNYFGAIFFSLGYWVNYNTSRSILSTQSIL